jgi:hypothetical protein
LSASQNRSTNDWSFNLIELLKYNHTIKDVAVSDAVVWASDQYSSDWLLLANNTVLTRLCLRNHSFRCCCRCCEIIKVMIVLFCKADLPPPTMMREILKCNTTLKVLQFVSSTQPSVAELGENIVDFLYKHNFTLLQTPFVNDEQLTRRNNSLLWKNVAPKLLDFAIALLPLDLPAYVVLEIFDWLPWMRRHVSHGKKIALIIGVRKSWQQIVVNR